MVQKGKNKQKKPKPYFLVISFQTTNQREHKEPAHGYWRGPGGPTIRAGVLGGPRAQPSTRTLSRVLKDKESRGNSPRKVGQGPPGIIRFHMSHSTLKSKSQNTSMGGTGQEGGDIYRHVAGLLPCTAETNVIL